MASVVCGSALVEGREWGLRLWRLGQAGWAAVRFGPRRALPLWCGSCGGVLVLVAVRRLGARSCFAVACAGPAGCGRGCFLSRLPGEPEPDPGRADETSEEFRYWEQVRNEDLTAEAELTPWEAQLETATREGRESDPQVGLPARSKFADLSIEELMQDIEKQNTEKWRHLHETFEIAVRPKHEESLMRTREREWRKLAVKSGVPRYLLWC